MKNRSQTRFGGGFSLRGKRGFWWEKVPSIQKLYKRNFSRFAIHNCKIFWGKAWKTTIYTTFLKFFQEIFNVWKRVYRMLSFSTAPSVSRKNVKKVTKKVLTGCTGRGIIYKSSRYGNKTKAKIVRHEPWKLNINLEKSECAGRAFYNARPSQITSF